MNQIDVTVYYLEMFERPDSLVIKPRADISVTTCQPTVRYYRYLYGAVGKDYHWGRANRMSDDELGEFLHHPQNEVHVPYEAGSPAGFAEFDCRQTDEIELLQFGLMPEYIGRGLGKWFLQWVIDKAFSKNPKRFWLHTCTMDHPIALRNYQQAGFKLYKEEIIQRDV